MSSSSASLPADPLVLLSQQAAVWRASQLAEPCARTLPTGFAALDAELPGGGWPAGALIELLCDHPGAGEISLLLPLMRRTPENRWLAWIAPPLPPYGPALAAAGLPLTRLLLIQPGSAAEILWATRQAVASAACTAVLCWPWQVNGAALRRLQLSAESGSTPLFLLRPQAAAQQPSPAPLRIALSADATRLRIDILKRRGPPAAAPLFVPLHSGAGLPVAATRTAAATVTPLRPRTR